MPPSAPAGNIPGTLAARPSVQTAAPTRPTAAPPSPAAPLRPATAARPGPAQNRGWLSDLLTRASLDEDEPEAPPQEPTRQESIRQESIRQEAAPQATIPQSTAAPSRTTLDGISTDIARMVDHQAAVELWQRYRRGDPNVFDETLYTAQGRQTFQELQRRYGADGEFRRTVDRYVGEFERLLGEVTKNDRDSRRADAYLTSETGKVYTMLAHASGRFEEM